MLFLHEVHRLVGTRWRDFEHAMRDDFRAILAKGDEARLLWYFHQAHGTGLSYTVVTVTGFTSAQAWHDFARRVQQGDLQGFATQLDGLRHEVRGKLLLPTPWSPMQEVDFARLDAAPAEHEPSLYMEDTGWPFEGKLDDYVVRWVSGTSRWCARAGSSRCRRSSNPRRAPGRAARSCSCRS